MIAHVVSRASTSSAALRGWSRSSSQPTPLVDRRTASSRRRVRPGRRRASTRERRPCGRPSPRSASRRAPAGSRAARRTSHRRSRSGAGCTAASGRRTVGSTSDRSLSARPDNEGRGHVGSPDPRSADVARGLRRPPQNPRGTRPDPRSARRRFRSLGGPSPVDGIHRFGYSCSVRRPMPGGPPWAAAAG